MKPTKRSDKFNPLSSAFRVTLSFVVILMALAATPSASAGDTALIPGPQVTFSHQRLGFICRRVLYCTCNVFDTTTLTNTGNATLRIYRMTITGDFSQTNNCGTSLGAGKSCTITVRWTHPHQNSSGDLYVYDNAPGSPQSVYLFSHNYC
jgi:hypothetical protein